METVFLSELGKSFKIPDCTSKEGCGIGDDSVTYLELSWF